MRLLVKISGGTFYQIQTDVYASGHEKVSSKNIGSGTLADKTPAH